MNVAIIGGGASGMVTAYLLSKKGHHVTVFEKQAMLGGNIRTLNRNVKSEHVDSDLFLECGVLEFSNEFHNFRHLMNELKVELEPVEIGTALFLNNGHYFLSPSMVRKNLSGMKRIKAYAKLARLYVPTMKLWLKACFTDTAHLHPQSIAQFVGADSTRNNWLKLLSMYSYSIPYDLISDMPAEMVIPALKKYMWAGWFRIKGGTYTYIEKILEQLNGDVFLNSEIVGITRNSSGVNIMLKDSSTQTFDKLVFATPPDQVLKLLSDPSREEVKRFDSWQANQVTTALHTDTSLYTRYGIDHYSEFDFFQTNNGWGYNASLNQLCGVNSPTQYSLAFKLAPLIAEEQVLHKQAHHTPLYTVTASRYRDEVTRNNGENNTYHAGAYLADGLHEGAITSAMRVAQLFEPL